MENFFYEGNRDKQYDLHFQNSFTLNCPKHFHRNFELLYIKDGEPFPVEVNGVKYQAGADDIIFVTNYYVHSFESCGHNQYCLIVPPFISGDFASKFKKKTFSPILNDKEFNKTLLPLLENDDMLNGSQIIKKGYMLVLVGKLLDHYPMVKLETNPDIEIVVKILNYIDENYDKDITLDSISSVFGYNKYYFSKLFNKYVKENLTSYINIVRIQNVMQKARKVSKPNIAQLAFENGFDSLATFYRYFSKLYNTSPTEYLEKLKSKNN